LTGINNSGQIFGTYTGLTCSRCLFFYDDGKYFDISVPLPANAPRPDGVPAGNAFLTNLGGMNDSGGFVGAYFRITEWTVDMRGELDIAKFEVKNFIATPQKPDKKN